MRLPESLRSPTTLLPGWLIAVVVGGVLAIVLIFFMTGVPWHEVGWPSLPRARFLGAIAGDPDGVRWIKADVHGNLWLDEQRVAADELEGLLRDEMRIVLAADANLPLHVLTQILTAAVAAGVQTVHVQVQPHNYLNVQLEDVWRMPDDVVVRSVVLRTLPVAEPARVLDESRKWLLEGTERRRISVRLGLEGNPDLQALVSALECYAPEGSVGLAGFTSK